MRRDNSDFKTDFISEAGTFGNNKDYFAFVELDDVACWIAADGIDSEEELNSAEIAVKSIFADFSEHPTINRRKLKKYINNAQKVLEEESRNIRLKCSLIMVVTDYSNMVWLSVGNARLYHFRKGRFNFKSKDQSIAQIMADAGEIGECDIDQNEERNNLTNYFGKPTSFKPFISKKYKLNDGDVMLLSTSGFWENVSIAEMVKVLKDSKEPSEFVDNLEDIFLSKQQIIVKNHTAAAIYGNKILKESNKDKINLIKKIALIMIPILIIVGTLVMYKIRDSKKQAQIKAELIKHEADGDEFVKDGTYDKALKEYEAAQGNLKNLRDKRKTKELDKRVKITQTITDGDKSFESKDFEKAMNSYKKAKKLASEVADYDKKELDKKIVKTENFMNILDVIKQGDLQFENQNFADAKETYEKAKGLADKASFDDAKKDLKTKLQETEAKMTDTNKKQKSAECNDLEKEGDKKLSEQKYAEAIEAYEAVKQKYEQINNLDGVLSIQDKIKSAQEKLNPLPPLPPPPTNDQTKKDSTEAQDKNTSSDAKK